MDMIVMAIAFLLFGATALGLISPSILKQTSRKNILKFFLLPALSCFLLAGVLYKDDPNEVDDSGINTTQGQPTTEVANESEENNDKKEVTSIDEKVEVGEGESLAEYAWRKEVLGKDYGALLKFGKGELYYLDPITKDEANSVGSTLELLGIFSDSKAISAQLSFDKKSGRYIFKMPIDNSNNIDIETINAFKEVGALLQAALGDGKELEVHITNKKLKTKKIIDPNQ